MKVKQFLKRLFTQNIVLKICLLVFAFLLAVGVSAIPPARTVPAEQDEAQVAVIREVNA